MFSDDCHLCDYGNPDLNTYLASLLIEIRNKWGTIAIIINFKILNYGCCEELDYCTV